MNRPLVLLSLALCLLAGTAAAQGLLEVGEDRPVGVTGNLIAVEPYLAADPRNPDHLVAGVALVAKLQDPRHPTAGQDEHHCAALASFDGGRTWARHDFAVPECLDPWVAVLPDGSALFLGLTFGAKGAEMVAFRSPDGGRTWSDTPVSFGHGHDHGSLAVDASGNVYVASHQRQPGKPRRDGIFVARSTDGGASFAEPARIVSSNLSAFALSPAVLADGTLAVPFINYSRRKPGGESDLFERAPAWVITSQDGGRTFSVPLFVTDVCAGNFPELAVDASAGPYRDRLYWICQDAEDEHVYVLSSADRGETWSEPVAVNRSGRSPLVGNAVLAVNRDGVLGVSWYDARNDPRGYRGSFRCQDVYFAASLDGGRTFLPEVKVSSAENCPDTPANGEAGRRWAAGGDYHGLAADAEGRFHVLWADSREGIYRLRTATVRVAGKAE